MKTPPKLELKSLREVSVLFSLGETASGQGLLHRNPGRCLDACKLTKLHAPKKPARIISNN